VNFADLIARRRILVCVGSGGVGKTTTAAALALAAARAGRRTLVLTIDPARRLANSFGLDHFDYQERPVPLAAIAPDAVERGGSLHAMMLDQKLAFDEIVTRYARDRDSRERIMRNRIYKQISTTLSGSHEYAAMAKLYSLALEDRYELIVLDTPPTANALDFLDSPEKLADAIDSPAIQWLIKPYLESGHFSIKLVGMGGAFVLKRIAKFVGSAFLEDMAQFIVEFNVILGGFRDRAHEVFQLLRRPDVAFVLVCSPDPLTVDEALAFHARLVSSRLPLGGFVVNRVHPRGPAAPPREELLRQLAGRPELRGYGDGDLLQVAADLDRTYGEFQTLAEIDGAQVARLTGIAADAPVAEIPLFDHDVHDVAALTHLGEYLLR
jgi:anion-transporting  ArsA/GET3 family ATPase